MTDHGDHIEGELVDPPGQLPAGQAAERRAQQAVVFNPLDADPVSFAAEVAKRQQNYDALTVFLRSKLNRGYHYGQIHVIPKRDCAAGNRCMNPWHWSGDELVAPGADTILSLLGLGVHYIGADGYREATLKGIQIQDVMIEAQVVTAGGQVLTEGNGSASVKTHNGDLHNTIAKAQKRARLMAVKRLPGVSSLFEQPPETGLTGDDMDRGPPPREDPSGERPRGNRYATGRELEVFPFGKNKSKPFTELSGRALEWYIDNVENKPDVVDACWRELDRRRLQVLEPEPGYGPPPAWTLTPDDDYSFLDDPPAR